MKKLPSRKFVPAHFPSGIDVDRLNRSLLIAVQKAARKWQENPPQEESVFLSRLIENLKLPRGGCDVGLEKPMLTVSDVYYLHRKGEKQTDQYGADLAVTLRIGKSWTKTAIFQLKKSDEYKLQLNRDDLKAAAEDERISKRSFIMAIDQQRLGVRLEKIEKLKTVYDNSPAENKTFHTTSWRPLSDWFLKWLRCELSPASSNRDPNSIERLLAAFRIEQPEQFDDFDLGHEEINTEDLWHVPAKIWIETTIQPDEEA